MQGYAGEAGQRDGWLLTSDLGRLDEHGNLSVLGRSDDVFISGLETLPSAKPLNNVRWLLFRRTDEGWTRMATGEGRTREPCLQDVAVTAVSDNVWGDMLVALYVSEQDCQGLQAWSRNRLPGFMRPREFVRVNALPRTALGKLQRKALPELVLPA